MHTRVTYHWMVIMLPLIPSGPEGFGGVLPQAYSLVVCGTNVLFIVVI
jgi:hypothetical protein